MLPFHLDRLWQSSGATGFGPAARAQGRQSLEQGTVETIARVTEVFREGTVENLVGALAVTLRGQRTEPTLKAWYLFLHPS